MTRQSIGSEIESATRRASARRRSRWGWRRRWGLGALALGVPFAPLPLDPAHAQSLPQGGTVVGGAGTIQQTTSTQLTINQASQNLSIDWQSFNVGAGNIVRFNQPSSSALALNRVIGPDPSQIFGSIQANGRVVIMNPAGIYFGPSSMVDVNGLVATTARMNQADFLAGTLNFSVGSSDPNARVVNEGAINIVQGGFAVLAAAAVQNKGTVIAQGGTVVLAGTPTFTLDFHGDGLLKFAATGVVNQAPNGANALVENSGTIQANGGRVLMTARSARDVINNVINTTGIVEARSARVENGQIVIDGGDNGIVSVNGVVDASGTAPDARGGNVTILGEKIGLFENARVNVAGAAGGGQALVGGNYLGRGPEPNAKMVYMDARAVIDASATANGDGGRVILWSDLYTSFQGTISARGGAFGGDGGFVETSSKDNLQVQTGRVHTAAAMGRGGSWLLDPRNVTITGATAGGTYSANVFTPTADNATIDVTTIVASLNAGTNVEVNTGGTGAQAGDITVASAISKTAGGAATLTLNAAGAIVVNSTITASVGALGVNLWAGGNVTINAGITTNNGNLVTAATGGGGRIGGNFSNTAGISTGTGNVTLTATGTIAIGAGINSSGIVSVDATGATTQTASIVGSSALAVGGTGSVTLNDGSNGIGSITLNRTGTTTNVSITTAISPNVQASTLGTGSFSLTGVGFAQSGAITQDANATGAVTIAGGTGTVTLSQSNTWSSDLNVTGGSITTTGGGITQTFFSAGTKTATFTQSGAGSMSLSNITAGAGSVNVNGYADAQLSIGGNITTLGGNVTLYADAPSGITGSGTGTGNRNGVAILSGADLNAGGGNIDIVGRSGNSSGNLGVSILGAQVRTSGTGYISITGLGTSTAGGHSIVVDNSSVTSTGTGSIAFMGFNPGGGNTALVAQGASVTLGGASFQNDLIFQVDSMTRSATSFSLTRQAGGGTVTFLAASGGDVILNGTGAGLGVASNILSGISNFGTIQAGSASATGSVTVGAAYTAPMNTNLVLVGTNGGTATVGYALTTQGTGGLTINGDGGVTIGANLTTAGGDILIKGNVASWAASYATNAPTFGTASGTFKGVDINGVIDAAGGNIAIAGKGGDTGNYNHGVVVGAVQIKTIGGGNITIHGLGGPSTGHVADNGAHIGVNLGAGAGIYTFNGDLKIVGTGGGAGTSENNVGIQVFNAEVHAGQIYGGSGGGAGNLTVTAIGGNGGSRGYVGDGTFGLYAETGSLTLTGTGGSGFNVNGDSTVWRSTGVQIGGGSAAITYGAGLLTITGTGTGGGAGNNVHGVDISGAGTYVRAAAGGGMSITGTGGNGSGGSNHGILLTTTNVDSTGASNMTLQGIAGAGAGSYGLSFDGGTVTIGGATMQGNLTLRTDSLSNTATTLALSRQAGSGTVIFRPENDATTIGVAGGAGTLQLTVPILSAIAGFATQEIGSSTQTGTITTATVGTVTRDTTFRSGTGGAVSFGGATLAASATLTFATGGALTQTGGISGGGTNTIWLSGGGDVTLTHGGNSFVQALVNKSGTGANVSLTTTGSLNLLSSDMGTGTLTLTGTGITQGSSLIQDVGSTGTITLNGGTGNIAFTDAGNILRGNVVLTTTGSGNASLTNQAPTATVLGASSIGGTLTLISGGNLTQTGALTVAGVGASSISVNGGTIVLTNAGNSFGGAVGLNTTGTNMAATILSGGNLTLGTVTITGDLTATATNTLALSMPNTYALGKNVTLSANGAGSAFLNFNASQTLQNGTLTATSARTINVTSGVTVNSGGGNITMSANASGANGGTDFAGIFVNGGTIESRGGNISLTGKGSASGTSAGAQHGIYLSSGIVRSYTTTGDGTNGTVTLNGAGGDFTSGNNGGVVLVGAVSRVSSRDGAITINATGGTGTGGGNTGLYIGGGTISTDGTGGITVTGTGTQGNASRGIAITGNGSGSYGRIETTGAGNINLTGTGGTTAGNNVGVYVWNDTGSGANYGVIRATGTGNMTVTGTGGIAVGVSNIGIAVQDANSVISTNSGTLTLSGTATSTGTSADGVYVALNGAVTSTSGFTSITGNSTTGAGIATGGSAWTIGGASSTGNIEIISDTAAFTTAGASIRTTGLTTIRPITASTTIGIGGGTGTLQLPGSMTFVDAGTLLIGSATAGAIDVGATGLAMHGNANLYLRGDSMTLNGNVTLGTSKTLTLHTLSYGVTQTAGGTITAGNLILRGGGDFTLTAGGSGFNTIEHVAADVVAAGGAGHISLRTMHASNLTTVESENDLNGTVAGITTPGNLTWVGAGGLAQAAAAPLAVIGNMTLTADAGNIAFNAGAANNVTGTVALTASAGAISYTATAGVLTLGNVTGGGAIAIARTGGANLVQVGGTTITQTGAGTVSIASGAGVTLRGITTVGDLTVSAGTGSITQAGAGLAVGGNASFSTTNGNIGLNAFANTVGGTVSLAASGGSVAWSESGNANFASVTAGTTLSIAVTGGSVSQVGAFNITGASSISAPNGITLTNATNAFGGLLQLTASAGSASVTSAGALQLDAITVQNSLTLTSGGTLTQPGLSPILVTTGTTALSSLGTMTLTNSSNEFGAALTLTGPTSPDNLIAGLPVAVSAANTGFFYNSVAVPSATAPSSPSNPSTVTSTTTVTTETVAALITQLLTSTTSTTTSSSSSSSSTAADAPGAAITPAAVQAALIAILSESATPTGGTGTGATGTGGTGNTQADGTPGTTGTAGTPPAGQGQQQTAPAPAGSFPAGTTITINTVGGTVASITVTPPAGGGPPQVILPGLLNLTPPAVPSATQAGTPGLTGAFMQNGNFR